MIQLLKYFFLSFLGSFAPSLIMNIEKRLLFWAGLCGALGYCIPYVFNTSGPFTLAQSFAGALVIGLYSELMAKYHETPATAFSIPGIFPLVPGISAYQTVQSIVENKVQDAVYYGINTVVKAFALAFGIMLVSSVFRSIRSRKASQKAKHVSFM